MSSCYRRITARTAASPASIHVQLRGATMKVWPLPRADADRRRRIVVLRLPRLRVIEAVRTGDGGEEKISRCSYAAEDQRPSGDLLVSGGGGKSADRTEEVLIAAGITVVLGVGNRVLYKLALVPLRHYPFFLAQLATFGFLVWQLLLSYTFLGRRYRFTQLLGCFLVAVGVIVTVASGSSTGSLMEAGLFWSLLMILSFLFQAADTILKEIIFLNAAKHLKVRSVDLFVVNSFGSAFQALFICLLLPFFSKLWGIPFYQLPNYLKDGAACFLNCGTISSGCDGAPLLPLLFVIVNMGFNISLLHLLKISSGVVSCIASTISVPISVFLFTLPLPYLGVASSLPPGFISAPYFAVGLLEALGAASGMAAAAILSGAAIPILSQSFLVWQLLLSYTFLGRRYRFTQLLGCFLVAVGVIVTVASGSSTGSLMEAGLFWSLLMILSFLFQAADTILKEIIFLNAAKHLKGRSVDLFVVNSFGSAFQALFICLLLPFLSKLWGIPFYQLPNYLKDGAACFLNCGTISSGCDGAPLLPLLFVIVNMGFNISLLHLLKISSGVVSCIASTISVPISVFLFTLPLPYLGVASSLPPGFISGAVVLLLGMLIYASTPILDPSVAPHPSSVD